MDLFISPHNDDAVLFGSFTILRARPHVAVVYDSVLQPARGYIGCDAGSRRKEDIEALNILGRTAAFDLTFIGLRDDDFGVGLTRAMLELQTHPSHGPDTDRVFYPAWERGGHAHHNLVSNVCESLFKTWTHVRYLTYTNAGKSTRGVRVAFEPDWPRLKLLALACYASQIRLSDNVEHFMRDQNEYLVA